MKNTRTNCNRSKLLAQYRGHQLQVVLCRRDGRALRVYADIPQVEEYLTPPEFVIATEPKDADIIWTSLQIDEETKKATGINDEQYINQFPFEACLVMKHHLAETILKAHGLVE